MIIICEGVDGSGKSTLAKQLVERFDLEYHHEGPPPASITPLEHYGLLLDRARGKDIVFDRFALGERVYGPVLRGVDRLGPDGWTVFTRLVRATAAIQVLCLPDYDVCESNWRHRKGELFRDADKFKETYAAYEYFAETIPELIHYDYADDSFEELCFTLQRAADSASVLPDGLVGSPTARTLFIGDRGGDPGYGVDLPFFATNRSSQYLTDALRAAELDEQDIAFMNTYRYRVGYAPSPRSFERVVALGQAAVKYCRLRGIEHRVVPHPSYWRRFHYADLQQYAQLLKDACQ